MTTPASERVPEMVEKFSETHEPEPGYVMPTWCSVTVGPIVIAEMDEALR